MEPGWTDTRLLSLQQEHGKLVFHMPTANARCSFLRLTRGHGGVLQALIKPGGRADAPLGRRELGGQLPPANVPTAPGAEPRLLETEVCANGGRYFRKRQKKYQGNNSFLNGSRKLTKQ